MKDLKLIFTPIVMFVTVIIGVFFMVMMILLGLILSIGFNLFRAFGFKNLSNRSSSIASSKDDIITEYSVVE